MLDGAQLAATAKHTPELLDPNEVRYAGHVVERYASLLRCVTVWHAHADDGSATLTVRLPADIASEVLSDWGDVMGGV